MQSTRVTAAATLALEDLATPVPADLPMTALEVLPTAAPGVPATTGQVVPNMMAQEVTPMMGLADRDIQVQEVHRMMAREETLTEAPGGLAMKVLAGLATLAQAVRAKIAQTYAGSMIRLAVVALLAGLAGITYADITVRVVAVLDGDTIR